MKFLVYSSVNIDVIFKVDHIVHPGETQSSFGFSTGAGGKGANQSAALAKAMGTSSCPCSNQVFLAGKCADDANFILEKLNSFGVNTSFMQPSSCGTGKAFIQVDKAGQNSIVIYGGGNQCIEKDEIDKVLATFTENDVLFLNCEINNLGYIVDQAFKKGMKIIVNPSPINCAIEEIDFSKVSAMIVNEVEGSLLSGLKSEAWEAILEALSKKWPDCEIVMTVGEQGAYYSFKGQLIKVPAVKTKVVDTTAAGDTFMGYFFSSRFNGQFNGLSAEASLKLASQASALTVSRPGAMDSIPFRDEVLG